MARRILLSRLSGIFRVTVFISNTHCITDRFMVNRSWDLDAGSRAQRGRHRDSQTASSSGRLNSARFDCLGETRHFSSMSAQEIIAELSKLKPGELQRLKEKLRIEETRRLQIALKGQPEYNAGAKPIWDIAEQIGVAVPR